MEIGILKIKDYKLWLKFLDAEVLMRYVNIEELRDIYKRASKTSWDRRHQKTEELDAAEANIQLGRAAVKDWNNITLDGEEFPYTPDNCDFLMSKWGEFSKFVNDSCSDIQALAEAEKESKIKNS